MATERINVLRVVTGVAEMFSQNECKYYVILGYQVEGL
jgi:hypothetical protein